MKTWKKLDCSQSICSSVHVKDWLKFAWNQKYILGVIRSKESEIPKTFFYIDEPLTWSKHIEEISKTITAEIRALKRLKDFASRDVLVSVCNALIMPHFDYCREVWDSLGSVLAERLQKLHNRCARVIMRYKNETGQY